MTRRDHEWLGRDRFVLSAGHSSLTQYVQLYFAGDGLELDDLESLRTWGSKTPGHPEYGHTDGVEITTGPLGQGLASAVGFAYAAALRARPVRSRMPRPARARSTTSSTSIAGDGDLQEGVTSEASSLAGHQQLGNLVVIYDSNQISIEDDTDIAFTEDVAKRYEAYGWHVQTVDWKKTGEYVEDVAELHARDRGGEGRDREAVDHHPQDDHRLAGPEQAEHRQDPRFGARRRRARRDQGGARLRPRAALRRRRRRARAHPRGASSAAPPSTPSGRSASTPGPRRTPSARQLLDRLEAGELPAGIEAALPVFEAGKDVSTRAASGKVLNALGGVLPELWGGSADLAESNNTTIEGAPSFIPSEQSTHELTGNPYGRVLHFGIREHAMGAILNGIVLHGPTRAFGGTFLIFSDYMRPAVRLAALMKVPVDLRLDARLRRARRRRPHPPADRAARRPCAPSRASTSCAPPTRTRSPGRGRRSSSAIGCPGRHRAHPAEHAGVRARRRRGGRRHARRGVRPCRRAPTCSPRPPTGTPRRDPDRDRLRGAVRRRGARGARRPKASTPASSRCRAWSGSRSRTPPTASRCCPPR